MMENPNDYETINLWDTLNDAEKLQIREIVGNAMDRTIDGLRGADNTILDLYEQWEYFVEVALRLELFDTDDYLNDTW